MTFYLLVNGEGDRLASFLDLAKAQRALKSLAPDEAEDVVILAYDAARYSPSPA